MENKERMQAGCVFLIKIVGKLILVLLSVIVVIILIFFNLFKKVANLKLSAV